MENLYNSIFAGLTLTDSQKAIMYLMLFWFVITIFVEMINAIRGI